LNEDQIILGRLKNEIFKNQTAIIDLEEAFTDIFIEKECSSAISVIALAVTAIELIDVAKKDDLEKGRMLEKIFSKALRLSDEEKQDVIRGI
jgi:hypothetical protein